MADLIKTLKNLIFFNEPSKEEEFILKENAVDKEKQDKDEESGKKHTPKKSEGISFKKLLSLEIDEDEKEDDKPQKEDDAVRTGPKISKKLENSLEYMKKVYSVPKNGDVIVREFDIIVKDRAIPAFILFIDGMTDRKIINTFILQPLMLISNLDIKSEEKDVGEFLRKHLLPQNQLKIVKTYREVIDEVNFGGCGLFVDGIDTAFAADVKGWEHRGIERPNNELVIRGPQEGFNEVLRVNTALVRKILKDEDLIVENIQIGKRSKTPCSMLYVKDIANDSLVNEVRRRLKSIKIDYLVDSGELEQLIEDKTFLPAPQIIATERPDRVAELVSDGRVAIMMHGSPFCLVVPVSGISLLHSAEDAYVRFPYATFFRLIRLMGILFSLLLPGMYLAITNFHQEMIPTDLLLAVEASRERVPFPSIIEILIMELAFELIREAGIRIPGPIGPTLGIIGALILGQAAVAANIVSPILIIIVAVTGIGSFAVPNFSFALSLRVLRFIYILLGAMAGFLGITTGVFIHGLFLVSAKSFGVPFMVPFGPKTADNIFNVISKAPIWKQERRFDYLNTKDEEKQPKISRGWVKRDKNNKKGNKE